MEEPVEYNAGKKQEERFVIKKQTNYHPPYGGWRSNGKEIIFTRQETIEKMARAICLCDDDSGCKGKCDKKCGVWKHSIPHARAALDALLGE